MHYVKKQHTAACCIWLHCTKLHGTKM